MKRNDLHIIFFLIITVLSGCKKKSQNILHVEVTGANPYNYGSTEFRNVNIDLDRNGSNDMIMSFSTDQITSQGNTITVRTLSIVDNNQVGQEVEVGATNDCIDFLDFDVRINDESYDWESVATIATDNIISNCNTNQNLSYPYFALRMKTGDSYRYGWMRITYNLANSNFEINEWAVHRVEGKQIKTGQTED